MSWHESELADFVALVAFRLPTSASSGLGDCDEDGAGELRVAFKELGL